MKQNELKKLTILGLAASLCLSAQSSPLDDARNVAMTRCSKQPEATDPQNDYDDTDSMDGQGDQSSQQEEIKQEAPKKKRISAAQAAIEAEILFQQEIDK